MSKNQPEWFDIEEGELLATFNEVNTLILEFQDNGIMKVVNIIDKNSNESKDVKQVSFQVIDTRDMKEKQFNVISKRLINELKNTFPLINKRFEITKIGQGFKTTYEVNEIKK